MPAHRSLHLVFWTWLALAILLLFFARALGQQKDGSSPTSSAPASAKATMSANYGHIPLSFEANRGQTDSSVQFLSRGQGYTLFLRRGEAVLALRSAKLNAPESTLAGNLADPRRRVGPDDESIETSIVRMKLVGANPHAAVREEDEQITKTNYFIGNDPSKWQTDIPNYGRVRYAGVYPGIDLVYYGNQSKLEHDFVVSPGADPSRIRLSVVGAGESKIDPVSGDVILNTGSGELRLLKPVAYQESDGQRTAVSSGYRLLARNEIGFEIASYDRARPLVIDPVLVYSTYLGGSGSNGHGDQGNGIVVDSAGDAYVVGTTYSTNFPITSDAFDSQNVSAFAGAGGTVFVSELNPTGTELLYSTYLGGSGGDYGFGIAIDSENNIYIAGATYSKDFPVTCGAFQAQNPSKTPGASVGFVAKLSSTGDGLVYSTYLGGSGAKDYSGKSYGDVVQAIALDANGDAYVTGYASSIDFPGMSAAGWWAGSSEAFAIELNPAGSRLAYSTIVKNPSGNVGSFGNAIVVDPAGDAFVASGGGGPSFITKLSPMGMNVVYSKYIDGDSAQAIAIDSDGNAYVAGFTHSQIPVTQGVLEGPGSGMDVYQWASSLSNDGAVPPGAFAAKLSPGGSIVWATYLEGFNTTPNAIAVDSSGNTYIAGQASTSNYGAFGGFQPTPDALPGPPAGGDSAFLVKLNADASVLNYATLLGGSNADSAMAIALDGNGNVYLTGSAASPNFPTTNGAFQPTNNDPRQGNAFVSESALAEENNQTLYPILSGPPEVLAVYFAMSAAACETDNFYQYVFDVTYTWYVEGPPGGPPWTGAFTISSGDISDFTYYFDAGSAEGDRIKLWCPECNPDMPDTLNYSVSYPGDANYQPVSLTGTVDVDHCDSGASSDAKSSRVPSPRFRLPLRLRSQSPKSEKPLTLKRDPTMLQQTLTGPKFSLPPARLPVTESKAIPQAQNRPSPGCIAGSGPLLTVTANSFTRAYGQPNPAFTYTISGLKKGDRITVTITTPVNAKSSVGAYPIVPAVSGAAVSKYSLMTVAGVLTVNPAKLSVAISPATASRLYGYPNPVFTLKETGLVKGETLSISNPATEASAVGKYVVTVAGPTLSNYAMTLHDAVLTVEPAPLTVTVSPATASREYGAPNPKFTFKAEGLRNSDKLSISVPPLTAPIGTYVVTVKGAKLSNYHLTVRTATLTITRAPLTVTVLPAKASRLYGSQNPKFICQATGLRNGDSVAPLIQFNTQAPVGVYKVTVKVSPKISNYAVTLHPAFLTVTPAPLSVKAINQTVKHGQPIPKLTYTITGFVLKQNESVVNGAPILSTTATPSSPVGTYPIVVKRGNLAAKNYSFALVNGTITIQ